jgi:hypothetical protein
VDRRDFIQRCCACCVQSHTQLQGVKRHVRSKKFNSNSIDFKKILIKNITARVAAAVEVRKGILLKPQFSTTTVTESVSSTHPYDNTNSPFDHVLFGFRSKRNGGPVTNGASDPATALRSEQEPQHSPVFGSIMYGRERCNGNVAR